MSVHIGLNAVDATHYAGWSGPLAACEFDAKDMAKIAQSRGMAATMLLTRSASRSAVLGAIRDAVRQLRSGDLFFLSYSGHGGQVPDVTGEEDDKQDETWCLYDGQLIDDELYLELTKFAGGVRILVLSDSCHSGTVVRAGPPAPGQGRPRMLPPDVAQRTYQQHRAFYDALQRDVLAAGGGAPAPDPDEALSHVDLASSNRLTAIADKLGAAVVLISGCQDNQTSLDGEHNGVFTEQLLKVWDGGKFQGNYATFHARIVAGMPASQTPNLFTLGAAAKLVREPPFTVAAKKTQPARAPAM
ncbi:MAG TPA: caspase family protein [Usitatibacter sp.]|nr:caspase family protein [Usitatibacter sp.]